MKKTGTIEALNVSPKGHYEGFLLRIGKKIVQINVPKEERETSAHCLKLGDEIHATVSTVEPHGEPDHEVFKLVRLLSGNGYVAGTGRHSTRNFSGQVIRLNYALRGEVNGGILDSGDFLHLKPRGARAIKLQVGMQVQGSGSTKPMICGHSVIEAEEVNGISIQGKKHDVKHDA